MKTGARLAALLTAACLAWPTHALMAGAAPDSPQQRVDPNTPASPWSSAVAVIVHGQTYSGVVVAPRYVLTAAHVAGGVAPGAISVQVNLQPRPVVHAVAAVTTFPGSSFPHDDLTLLELAAPVPAALPIPPIWRGPVAPGQLLTLVGYGASGQGDVGVTVAADPGVKRIGRNVLDVIRDSLPGQPGRSRYYLFDFDGPQGPGPLGGVTLGNAIEAGLAGGDSGSPAFTVITGRVWLIGLNTFVWGEAKVRYGFGTGGGGVLLNDPRFLAWLDEQTQGTLTPPGVSGSAPSPRR